jgi:hypothetical protein
MKDKTFDCVEMMHRGQEELQKRLQGMSDEEQLAFWRRQSEEFKKSVEEARRKRQADEESAAGTR